MLSPKSESEIDEFTVQSKKNVSIFSKDLHCAKNYKSRIGIDDDTDRSDGCQGSSSEEESEFEDPHNRLEFLNTVNCLQRLKLQKVKLN